VQAGGRAAGLWVRVLGTMRRREPRQRGAGGPRRRVGWGGSWWLCLGWYGGLLWSGHAKRAVGQTGIILFQAASNILVTWKQGGKRLYK